jgi:hypothetical protein
VNSLTRASSSRSSGVSGTTPCPTEPHKFSGFRRTKETGASALPVAAPRPGEDCEEALVADPRAGLTPSQMVERKLLSLLDGRALPVSHVQLVPLPHGRRAK